MMLRVCVSQSAVFFEDVAPVQHCCHDARDVVTVIWNWNSGNDFNSSSSHCYTGNHDE